MAGFEAVAGSRRVTFQVQNRHRAQDCCLQCGPSPGQPRRCAGGKCCCTGDPVGSSWLGCSERAGMKHGGYEGLRAPARSPWCLGGGSLAVEISAFPFPSLCLSWGFTHPFAWPSLHLCSVVPFESN